MAASYGAPGVYIEEQPSGSMPIEGVGTAVAAFVGFTEFYDAEQGDPTDPSGVKPQLVTSWPQFERIYGGFVRGAMLPSAATSRTAAARPTSAAFPPPRTVTAAASRR
jgi:phage tail sheath protein FI